MKTQEAIKELKGYADNSWGSLNEAFEMAIKSLEKQIPKKPKERQGTTYSFCPCCDSNNIYEYCGDCGQKIDWSDTNEQNDR
jgi:hypothetical protein